MQNKFVGLGICLLFACAAFLLPGCGTQHSVATYTVFYNANGATSGDVPTDSTRYQSDLSVTVLSNTGHLQKAGYVFAGWNTDPGGTGTNYTEGQKFSIKSSNATLYACWSDRSTTYTVTYNGNGNTGGAVPTDSTSYKAGQIITVKGNTGSLVKTGYTFAGWNTRSDGTGHVYTQADTFAMGMANVTLYANWTTKATYTVTYDGNGATSGTVPTDTTNYETGYSVTVLDNTGGLVKTGSAFVGWNTRADGTGTTYAYGQEFVMGLANVTLYAKWSTQTTYSVTYDGNGNTSGSAPTDLTNYETGQVVEVLANTGNLEKSGYYFAGWNTRADGTGVTYLQDQTFSMGSANVTLYAKWGSTIAYTVTYDGNGNTGGSVPTDSNTYAPGYTVTVLGNTGTLEKTGSVFAGWNTKADGTGVVYTQADTFSMGFTNIMLYANWTADTTYTVTYSSNEATSGEVPIDTTNYKTGYSVTILDNTGNLERTGYDFIGWNTAADGSGVTYTFGQEFIMGSANVTLYAKWASSTYKVTYNGNDSTSGDPPVDLTNYEAGQSVHVLGNLGNLEKTNYRFGGWNTRADGAGTTYIPGQTFTMGSADVNLYAKWDSNLCVFEFNSQGGSSVPSLAVRYGELATQPSNPTKAGHTFAGWFKEGDCIHPWFFDYDRVTASPTIVYAKWTINQHTVSFNSQGGTEVSPETVTYGQKATRPTDPTWTGHTFIGWFKDKECTESWVFATDVVTNNITLYAGWEIAFYGVNFDSQGGTIVSSQVVDYGKKASMPTRPTKGDYALAGWYTEAACINKWAFCTNVVTCDVTLYAKWQYYDIGDIGPAGGWVFFDAGHYGAGGWRYLEAAPSDLKHHEIWGNNNTDTSAKGDLLGDGAENTTKIINAYGSGFVYAARSCKELIVGDFHDWSMPSRHEVERMLYELAVKRQIGNFWREYYWSSTEKDKNSAYAFFPKTEIPEYALAKNGYNQVRAVRYF